MKINQYCSVCKKHLDMELVPTDGGGADDGVIWLRCPECRGFLPKFSSERFAGDPPPVEAPDGATARADDLPAGVELADAAGADDALAAADLAGDEDDGDGDDAPPSPRAADPGERDSVAAYAAALAAADASDPRPYRSTDDYRVGEVIFHLAWDDCGLVLDKVALPGNRRAIRAYFPSAGVVHLIEQSAGGA